MEVTLQQVLDAREARAYMQSSLIEKYQCPLISFTMNIAGPIKDTPLIRRGFDTGVEQIIEALEQADLPILYQTKRYEVTGCEGYFAVDGDAQQIKDICVLVEERTVLGRLFDIDVVSVTGEQLRRATERCCLVCGKPGKGCASRRLHSVAELQMATTNILTNYFYESDLQNVATLAHQALLSEVNATPKPGLVDRRNTGSHADMDIHTFYRSADALTDYFLEATRLGMDRQMQDPNTVFTQLRSLGIRAEQNMFRATNGVNTHKGAIFTMGILCCAIGRLWRAEQPCKDARRILDMSTKLSQEAIQGDFELMNEKMNRNEPLTVGEELYLHHGIGGIRQEVLEGLPSIFHTALPKYTRLIQEMSENDAACITLLYLLSEVTDTNMIHRGGIEVALAEKKAIRSLLAHEPTPSMNMIESIDDDYIKKNLSPGGCADLLSATIFLYNWTK